MSDDSVHPIVALFPAVVCKCEYCGVPITAQDVAIHKWCLEEAGGLNRTEFVELLKDLLRELKDKNERAKKRLDF